MSRIDFFIIIGFNKFVYTATIGRLNSRNKLGVNQYRIFIFHIQLNYIIIQKQFWHDAW